MSLTKVRIVGDMHGDWFTLYIDDKRIYADHSINEHLVESILLHCGKELDFKYKELNEEQWLKYEGEQLPDDYNELGFSE